MIFFTSDHHFGHKNIIRHAGRPFDDLYHMDTDMLARWNAVVSPVDIVYHLGDVAVRSDMRHYMSRANGRKILILGNHDKPKHAEQSGCFEAIHDVLYLRWEGYKFWLSHYPHESWRGSGQGSFHLHGHTHKKGNIVDATRNNRLNVNVEFHEFYPIPIRMVVEQIEKARARNGPPYISGELPEEL